jgi:ABC-2 type transport system ATP-binding protein
VSVALATRGVGKRYGRHWALSGCTLEVTAGHVAGIVGPNGAGKTTLLLLAVGLTEPSAGSIAVLGEEVAATPAQLARVGFVAQETPLYASLSVADHMRLGAALNPGWERRSRRRGSRGSVSTARSAPARSRAGSARSSR